ncbi:MAG: hypothetical protein KBA81_08410 [Rhabdochlamydiaceae bacterium]|nr:hypothetical protein [Rhabdochlamydiaceae bacterium]
MNDIDADLQVTINETEDRLVQTDSYHPLIVYLFISNDCERAKAWNKLLKGFSKNPKAKGYVVDVLETYEALCKYLSALREALGENPSHEEADVLIDVSDWYIK